MNLFQEIAQARADVVKSAGSKAAPKQLILSGPSWTNVTENIPCKNCKQSVINTRTLWGMKVVIDDTMGPGTFYLKQE